MVNTQPAAPIADQPQRPGGVKLYNMSMAAPNLPIFQQAMVKLGIITIVDQVGAEASEGQVKVGDVVSVPPNLWDDMATQLDQKNAQPGVDPKAFQKGGGPAYFVNILTAIDLIPALTQLAQGGDQTVAPILQRPADYFFVDAQNNVIDDPAPKRVML